MKCIEVFHVEGPSWDRANRMIEQRAGSLGEWLDDHVVTPEGPQSQNNEMLASCGPLYKTYLE